MPKINPIKVYCQGVGDLRFSYSYPTEVLSTGIFQTLIPDEQVDVIRGLMKRQNLQGVEYKTNRAGKPVLQATELASIQRVVEAYGRTRIETVNQTELVIFYRLASNTAYYVKGDEVFPSGVGVEGGHWVNPGGGSHQNRLDYTVGVTARIVAKTTARFAGGFHITHGTPDLPEESFGARLNAFTNVKCPDKDFWSLKVEGERREPLHDNNPSGFRIYNHTGWQFMPYTEENAKFFFEMMLNVCRLSERIARFFGDDPQHLLDNISSVKALPNFSE